MKEGKADALIIELPKGGYVPRFRELEAERQVAAPIPAETFSAAWRAILAGARACLPGYWASGRRVVVDSTHGARRFRLRFCPGEYQPRSRQRLLRRRPYR